MPPVKISRAGSDRRQIEIEVARLRDLDLGELRARWHTVFGRRPPSVICCSVFSPIGFRPMPWAILTETVNESSIAQTRSKPQENRRESWVTGWEPFSKAPSFRS